MTNTLAIKLGRPAWSVLRRYILENRPLWFFVAFGALTTYILWPFYPDETELRNKWVGNVAVEGFGFLMDIILFGLLWSVFDVYRERRAKIRGYQDELMDFIPWEGQEGVLRKVGIIKRLNELQASLPVSWRIHLKGADLRRANLGGAVLRSANLAGANLQDANLAGANLLHANLEGALLLRANLEGALLFDANLEGTHLTDANLEGADLSNANLAGAFLLKTNLEGADLEKANLKDASLWSANLAFALLMDANLEGADLKRVKLEGADLRWANLEGAILLTWDQLEQAKTNDQTILPAYLKENAPESYMGRFAGEEGE